MIQRPRRAQRILESLRLIPPHGIQIETQRGFLKWALSTERHFIPSTALSDVFIHEGLHGWNVLYYLAVCYRDEQGNATLRVAFEVRCLDFKGCITNTTSLLESTSPTRCPLARIQSLSRHDVHILGSKIKLTTFWHYIYLDG